MGKAAKMFAVIFCVVFGNVARAEETTQITILATNDIHGSIEPNVLSDGTREGGLAMFSGVVQAIKAGLRHRLGNQVGVLVVDAGDQFQGTLLSNVNEGQLLIKAMSKIGYD